LIGYRAFGKFTINKLVSDRLGWPLLDIDRSIENKSGISVRDLFVGQAMPWIGMSN